MRMEVHVLFIFFFIFFPFSFVFSYRISSLDFLLQLSHERFVGDKVSKRGFWVQYRSYLQE